MTLLKRVKKLLPVSVRESTALLLASCFLITAFSAAFSAYFVSAEDTAVLVPVKFDFEYAQTGTDVSESSFGIVSDPTDSENKVLKLNGTDGKAPASGKINAVFLTSDGNGKYFLESGTYYAFSMDVYVPSDSGKDKFSMALQGLDGTKTALSYNTSPFNQSANTFFQLSYNPASEIRQQKITEWSAKTEIDGIKKGAWISISGYFNTSNNLGANTALALNINCDDFTAFSPCFDNIEIYRLDKNKASILINTRNKSGDVVVLEGEEGETVDPADYISNSGYDFSGCYNYKKTDLVYGGGSWGQTGELDLSDANRFSGVFPGAGVYMVCADWVKNAALEPDAVFGFSYPAADADIAESSFSVVTDPANADNKVLQLNGTDEKAPVSGKTNAIYLTTDGTAGSIYRLMPGNKFYAFSVDIYLPEGGADDFSLAFNALNTSKTALSYNANAFSSYNTADYQLIYNSAENVQQQKITNWGGRVEFSGFRTGKWVTVAGYFKTTNSFSEGSGIALSVDSADMADFKPYFDNIKIYALDTSKTNLIIKTGNAAGDILVLQGTEGQEMNAGDYLINEGYNLLGCYNYEKTQLTYGNGSWGQCAELDTSTDNRLGNVFPSAGISMACAVWEKVGEVKTYELSFDDYPDDGGFGTGAFSVSGQLSYDDDDASLKFNPGDGAAQWSGYLGYLNDGGSNLILKANKIYAFSFYWYMPADVIGLGGGPEMQFVAASDLSLIQGTYQKLTTRVSMSDRGQSNTISWQGKVTLSDSMPPRGKWVKQVGYFTTGNNLAHTKLAVQLTKTNGADKKYEMYIDCLTITEISGTQSVVIVDSGNENEDSVLLYGNPSSEMSIPTFNKSEFDAVGYYCYNLDDSSFPDGKNAILHSTAQKLDFTETEKFPDEAGAVIVQIEWEWDINAAKTYSFDFEDYSSDGDSQNGQFVKSDDYSVSGEYSLKTVSPDGLATWQAFSGRLKQGEEPMALKPGKIYAYNFYTYIPLDNLSYNSGIQFAFAALGEDGSVTQLETRISMDAAAGQQNLQGGKNVMLFAPNQTKGIWIRQNGYFITPSSLGSSELGLQIAKTVAADKTQILYFDKMKITEIDSSQSVVVVNTEKADSEVRFFYGKPGTDVNIGQMEYENFKLAGWYTFNITAGANRKPSDSRIDFEGVDDNLTLTLPDKAGATIIYADWQLSDSINQGDDVTVGFEDYSYTGTEHANVAFSKNTENYKSGSASLECNRYAEQTLTYSATHINVDGAPYLLENGEKYVIDFWYCVESNFTDVINLHIKPTDRNNPNLGLVSWSEYTYKPGEPLAIRYKEYKTGQWYHFTTSITAQVTGDADALALCWQESRVDGRTENSGMTMLIDDFRIRKISADDSYIYVSMGVDGVEDPVIVGKESDRVTLPEPADRPSYVFEGFETYEYIRSDEIKGYVKEGKSYDGKNAVLPENYLYVYAKWRRVSYIQDFENYMPNSYFNSLISDMEIYGPDSENYSSENVHGGKYSLHRKGNIDSTRTIGLFSDEETMLETGEKYRFKLWIKVAGVTDKNAILQYVNAKSANVPDSADMDPVDLARIGDLETGKWEWVSAEFTTVDRYLSIIIPAGCEVYIDDITLVKEGDPWPEGNTEFELSPPVSYIDDNTIDIPQLDIESGNEDRHESVDAEDGDNEDMPNQDTAVSEQHKPQSSAKYEYIIIDIWQIVLTALSGAVFAGIIVALIVITRKNKKLKGEIK